MSNANTAPSDVNPDPTKWLDRITEFKAASGKIFGYAAAFFAGPLISLGLSTLFGMGELAIDVACVAATGAAVCGAAAVTAVASAIHTASGGVFVSDKPVQPRTLARKMGFVFSGLAALTAGGISAYSIVSAPVSATPEVVFNATAQDCKSARVKAAIETIRAQGFPVICRKPLL